MDKINTQSESIEIASLGYRIAHHLNLAFFTILAITGSALFASNIFQWMDYAVGYPFAVITGTDPISMGAEVLRAMHRIFAFFWGVLLIVYGLYLVVFKKIRMFDAIRRPLREQIEEAKALARHYLFGDPIPQPVIERAERHNVMVVYMTFLLLISFPLLSISGVLLVYRFSLGLSQSTTQMLLMLHDIGFILALIFVFLHLFASLHPTNRPLLMAMFGDGKAPIEWAEKYFGAYIRRYGRRGSK
nr:MAG: formate dehydrogenase [Thermoproteus sp. AZ2]